MWGHQERLSRCGQPKSSRHKSQRGFAEQPTDTTFVTRPVAKTIGLGAVLVLIAKASARRL